MDVRRRKKPEESGKRGWVWRRIGIIALVLMVVGTIALHAGSQLAVFKVSPFTVEMTDAILAGLWLVLSAWLIGSGRRVLAAQRDREAFGERRVWNLYLNLFTVMGYLYSFLMALAVLRLNLGGLLVGGAVTGIIVGIAAQSALGNLFGGILVLLLHPYSVGDRVTMRSASFGGSEYTGTVREITLFYTTLDQGPNQLVIPNSTTVNAVVRLEGSGDVESVVVSLPYAVSPDQVRAAMRSLDLGQRGVVESFSSDQYLMRIEIPARRTDAVATLMRRLQQPEASG